MAQPHRVVSTLEAEGSLSWLVVPGEEAIVSFSCVNQRVPSVMTSTLAALGDFFHIESPKLHSHSGKHELC